MECPVTSWKNSKDEKPESNLLVVICYRYMNESYWITQVCRGTYLEVLNEINIQEIYWLPVPYQLTQFTNEYPWLPNEYPIKPKAKNDPVVA